MSVCVLQLFPLSCNSHNRTAQGLPVLKRLSLFWPHVILNSVQLHFDKNYFALWNSSTQFLGHRNWYLWLVMINIIETQQTRKQLVTYWCFHLVWHKNTEEMTGSIKKVHYCLLEIGGLNVKHLFHHYTEKLEILCCFYVASLCVISCITQLITQRLTT